MTGTVKQSEINTFQKDSAHWWDENGPFAPLHKLNPLRLDFIRDTLEGAWMCEPEALNKPLKHLSILDVGCGGGLVCEPLARLGARVTGLDADAQAVQVAREHAKLMSLKINYFSEPIEKYNKNGNAFDVITALEIVEHVDDLTFFLKELSKALKPKGILIISTLNRTVKSYLLGILAAEHLLRWVPVGTHSWKQFVKPSELTKSLKPMGLMPLRAAGLTPRLPDLTFRLSPHDLNVNYIMAFRKA